MKNQIFLDVDGCLIKTDPGDPGNEYYLGLSEVASQVADSKTGILLPIGFCTGRDRNYVEAVAYVLGLPDGWSVIESGVAIFNSETKELKTNPAITDQAKEAFREISDTVIPSVLKAYPYLFLYPGNMLNIALERYSGAPSIKECFRTIEQELKVYKEIVYITHSDIAIDISPAGINKGTGLEFLADCAGIDLTRSLGIEDSKGGIPMLERVGYVGCPANASPECQEFVEKAGGCVARRQYARGVAEIVRRFRKDLRGG